MYICMINIILKINSFKNWYCPFLAPTEDDLADVIEEVKKLSDEVMLDSNSDGMSDDSEEG